MDVAVSPIQIQAHPTVARGRLRMPMHPISVPVFEGPLDLLLELIERRQLDITKVSLLAVTEQYLSYLAGADQDSDALADFVAVAAKLVLIKSRSLLPQPVVSPEGEPDPGDDLVSQLAEYRRFRDAALTLREYESLDQRCYPRIAPPPAIGWRLQPGAGNRQDLAQAIVKMLRRTMPAPVEAISRRLFTVGEKVGLLLGLLLKHSSFAFGPIARSCSSRHEVVVTFLALLELLRTGRAEVEQEAPFAEVTVLLRRKGSHGRTR